MTIDEFIAAEQRDRLRARIASAGDRRFGESPLEGLPPSPTSTKVIPLRGPVQVVLEPAEPPLSAALRRV
ncbi:MAG TPA: hypothetical protein VM869_35765 [Enhygromyxa sp.]|jgi:hypothetical protein|nr:hypothetical protein [Enhygromyxa sp.]